MVYVLNKQGKPIMPTNRCGKVRRLLKENKAKVVKRTPFTIQLLYDTTEYVQPVSLGVDAGSKHVGLSVTTEEKVLYEADVELRNDIVDLLSSRRSLRSNRRNRKTRYRAPRFDNRKTKKKGWIAPSIEHKIQTHFKAVENVCEILPISNIVVETASFDTQKLKAIDQGQPLPQGPDYQQGEQLGSRNIREYVLFRDGHKCRCCKGKSKEPVLQVHHIESRKTGGDAPNNLVTLCKTCHKGYHQGKIELPESIKRGNKYNDAAFMGIMRWSFYDRLKEQYPNVSLTYGYITKNTRIKNSLPKEHYIDARCISGHPLAVSDGICYYYKKVRCHNRQLHKCTTLKGGVRKRNQAEYLVRGFRLFDKVSYQGKEYFVFARRITGFFNIRDLQGNKLEVNPKKLRLLETRKGYLIERRNLLENTSCC